MVTRLPPIWLALVQVAVRWGFRRRRGYGGCERRRFRARHAPEIATIRAAGHTVARSSTLRPSKRHNIDGPAHRGQPERPAPIKAPRHRWPGTPWQVRAPCAHQIATTSVAGHTVARPSALRPSHRHDPGEPADRGRLRRPDVADLASPHPRSAPQVHQAWSSPCRRRPSRSPGHAMPPAGIATSPGSQTRLKMAKVESAKYAGSHQDRGTIRAKAAKPRKLRRP